MESTTNINLKFECNSEVVSMSFTPQTSVMALKVVLSSQKDFLEKSNIPKNAELLLEYNGQVLDTQKTLEECKIKTNSRIRVMCNPNQIVDVFKGQDTQNNLPLEVQTVSSPQNVQKAVLSEIDKNMGYSYSRLLFRLCFQNKIVTNITDTVQEKVSETIDYAKLQIEDMVDNTVKAVSTEVRKQVKGTLEDVIKTVDSSIPKISKTVNEEAKFLTANILKGFKKPNIVFVRIIFEFPEDFSDKKIHSEIKKESKIELFSDKFLYELFTIFEKIDHNYHIEVIHSNYLVSSKIVRNYLKKAEDEIGVNCKEKIKKDMIEIEMKEKNFYSKIKPIFRDEKVDVLKKDMKEKINQFKKSDKRFCKLVDLAKKKNLSTKDTDYFYEGILKISSDELKTTKEMVKDLNKEFDALEVDRTQEELMRKIESFYYKKEKKSKFELGYCRLCTMETAIILLLYSFSLQTVDRIKMNEIFLRKFEKSTKLIDIFFYYYVLQKEYRRNEFQKEIREQLHQTVLKLEKMKNQKSKEAPIPKKKHKKKKKKEKKSKTKSEEKKDVKRGKYVKSLNFFINNTEITKDGCDEIGLVHFNVNPGSSSLIGTNKAVYPKITWTKKRSQAITGFLFVQSFHEHDSEEFEKDKIKDGFEIIPKDLNSGINKIYLSTTFNGKHNYLCFTRKVTDNFKPITDMKFILKDKPFNGKTYFDNETGIKFKVFQKESVSVDLNSNTGNSIKKGIINIFTGGRSVPCVYLVFTNEK